MEDRRPVPNGSVHQTNGVLQSSSQESCEVATSYHESPLLLFATEIAAPGLAASKLITPDAADHERRNGTSAGNDCRQDGYLHPCTADSVTGWFGYKPHFLERVHQHALLSKFDQASAISCGSTRIALSPDGGAGYRR